MKYPSEFGRDQGELTTRQNIQLHYITLDRFPEIFEQLKGAGLTTLGGCGDVVRNITGCPVGGVDQEEHFDVTGLLAEAAGFFYGNRDYSDLPRKHKITISACHYQCNAPEINCVALVGFVKDGTPGFAVRVGGGQSSTPRLSRHLGVFVRPPRRWGCCGRSSTCGRSTTEYRISRVKARLKFMIDDYGPDEFRKLVEARLGRELEPLAELPLPDSDRDHMGINEQKQDGPLLRWFSGVPGNDEREPDARDGGTGGKLRRRHPRDPAPEFHPYRDPARTP